MPRTPRSGRPSAGRWTPSAPEISQQFCEFLSGAARDAAALYVLGDLFEAWLGDDDPSPDKHRVTAALKALADSGVALYVMHGNRDFLLGPRFAADTGGVLLTDPTPSRVVAGRELVEEIQRRFNEEERRLFRERSQGHDWAAIASAAPDEET